MSRSFFSSHSRQASSSNSNPDNDPLLPLDSESQDSISLRNLSPHPSHTRSLAASPSPPPSFYRSKSPHTENSIRPPTLSPSPSRTKTRNRTIQFAAPPPPITGSVLLPRNNYSRRDVSLGISTGEYERDPSPARILSPQSRRRGSVVDPLLGLERRERAIAKELQELLDAQSAGLVAGLGAGAGDKNGSLDGSEAGSSTPTYASTTRSRSAGRRDKGVVVPVRQPKKKVLGLRGARRGLLRDIGELAGVKSEEVSILESEIERREDVLGKVKVWEERIESFRKQLGSSVENAEEGEEGRELAGLREEEKAVENEIREVEDRLAQMKARKRWLGERIKGAENRKEAQLSSYRGALREVEEEVASFLYRPPVFAIEVGHRDEEGFMDLPSRRRTLGMAKDLWRKQVEKLQARIANTEKEREALEEGAKVWEESARVVMEYEDELRMQMKSTSGMGDKDMLKAQVGKMGRVIERLQQNMGMAEAKHWNLLICAVGAELEAFREGEAILRGALGVIEGDQVNLPDDDGMDGIDVRGNGLEELNGELERGDSVERDDSEDDGPNLAELMVDHGHGDGDGENSLD